MVAVQDQIVSFIKENFIVGRSDVAIEPAGSLIESGIIDSTGVLELVMFLEETFNITIEDDELVPENLDSVNNLVSFLKRKGIK